MRYVDELTSALRAQLAMAYGVKDQLGFGLRQRLREGYDRAALRADVRAGLAVAMIALPLSLALATTLNVPPQFGLYSAVIAGIVVPLLGGTRVQVTGPTAAYVILLLPIVHKHGLGGLLVSGLLAGVILLALGLGRFGKLITFVPHPVTTGLTLGIAVVLALIQLEDLLGLSLGPTEGTLGFVDGLWSARHAVKPWDVGLGVLTLALLAGLPRLPRLGARLPVSLVAIAVAALAVVAARAVFDQASFATIGSSFTQLLGGHEVNGIPPAAPMPIVPWALGDASGTAFTLDYATIRELLPSAFAIAILGALECLLTAVMADGMSGSKHDPNAELIALGLGNIACPFFGGMPAGAAMARTAANIRAGAQSPIATIVQAVVIAIAGIVLAPALGYVPLAALAALLLAVAWHMAEPRHVLRLLRVAPRSDVVVMLTCFGLTVLFDLVIAVTVGIVLAALLFMRRMAVLTKVSLETDAEVVATAPPGVKVYHVAGPLFFGAAKTALGAIERVDPSARAIVLAMTGVPTIDATGLVALESVLDRLQRGNRTVVIAGLPAEPAAMLARAGIRANAGQLAFAPDVETAIQIASAQLAHGQASS